MGAWLNTKPATNIAIYNLNNLAELQRNMLILNERRLSLEFSF